ncbi:flagellar FlbD family protein [Microbacterium sp. p3-SID336]|uniref:flagellar FlbD family protein n=1 Tax=Microbacterium sp. p3-SID336 TaxID=2916212 RepID=UPI0021A8D560|nr:flagellar FlbD family protein [Microbacterium sp. p3-SID336]MCT1477830.1 flagellar FlbD family protein [Microbacterium sp. p3-SID336]
MIVLTRLNRSRFAVNPDLIERVQATPDTTIMMVDGATFVVTESMDDVIALITRFRAGVLAAAAALVAADGATPTAGTAPTGGGA